MPYMAPVYFSTFVLASQFVLVNVVVAVLMKQLEDAKELVSPSSSQASGLNTDLEEQEKENENKEEEDNEKSNIEMLQLQKKSLKREMEEEEPLLNINDNENDHVDGFSHNLVSLDDTKVKRNEEPSWSTTEIEYNKNDNIHSFVPNIRLEDQEPKDNKHHQHEDIESTLKDMLEIVATNSNNDSMSMNGDHLEVDLLGTALALSGLRDSVISTCV